MNSVLIAFLILVIVFAIYMVVRIFDPSYLIRDPVPLNILKTEKKSQYVIPVESIDNPGSARYYYEGWFYVNLNEPVNSENVLFNRGDDFVVTLKGSTLNVYVNAKPQSGNRVSAVGVFDTSGISQPFASIPNLPFQKWCQLVINVDGTSVDFYIDGKFVKNSKNSIAINANLTDPITYGNHYTIGSLTRFKRMDTNVNPQGVWNSYMNGSGQNASMNDYHLNAQVTKNKVVRVDQRLV
jgi:hypothetical protein